MQLNHEYLLLESRSELTAAQHIVADQYLSGADDLLANLGGLIREHGDWPEPGDIKVGFPDGLQVVAAVYGYLRNHKNCDEDWLAAQAQKMYRGLAQQTE